MNTKTVTAQNCSLFEIDAELDEAFDQLQEEREITGTERSRLSLLIVLLGLAVTLQAVVQIVQHLRYFGVADRMLAPG